MYYEGGTGTSLQFVNQQAFRGPMGRGGCTIIYFWYINTFTLLTSKGAAPILVQTLAKLTWEIAKFHSALNRYHFKVTRYANNRFAVGNYCRCHNE